MATRFVLKRKNFATILADGNNIVTGAAAPTRSQSYYDSLSKDWGNASNKELINSNKGVRIGTDAGTRTLGGDTVYSKTAPKMNTQQVAQTSFKNGQKSVGIMQGMKNTWGKMGTMGKAGTIAGAAVLTGLAAKGLFGGKKKNN